MRHSHHDFVEQFPRTLNHIQMTVCHRIEAAGINRTSHLRKFAEEFQNEKQIGGHGLRARDLPCRIVSQRESPMLSWLSFRLTKPLPWRRRFRRASSRFLPKRSESKNV